MTEETKPILPPLRLSATSVVSLLGFNYRDSPAHALASLRRQRLNVPPKERTNQFVTTQVYWTLVGLIRDNYTQTTEQHIDTIKNYLEEEHPDSWYAKLYSCVRTSVGGVIHEEMCTNQPTTVRELLLTPEIMLVGKPDIVENDTVIEIKTCKSFAEKLQEGNKVQVFCYMKILGLQRGILREVMGTETKDTPIEWDDTYWDKIQRTVFVLLEWL